MAKDLDTARSWASEMVGRKAPCASLDWTDAGALTIKVEGEWSRILRASGNTAVCDGLIKQMASLGSHGNRIDPSTTDFALGFVDAIQPRDAAEALLASQMAAIQQAMMMMARRLNHVENLQQQNSAERALNKLARTYAAQMDTLKRYRSKGQQTVRVERVTVEDGGQAIVGDVQTGGRGRDER